MSKLDFLVISSRPTKRGMIEIYPNFRIMRSNDLMIRGGDFYAIWMEERGLWSTDEQDVIHLIDRELDRYVEENKQRFDGGYRVMHMWDSETGMIDKWHKYCQRQMRDSFQMLDERLIFANMETCKKDYASKRLPYPLEGKPCDNWSRLMEVLYSQERHKIEWAIGSIVSGDSRKLQKFMVLYGAPGTGKGTVIEVIERLFEGYIGVFDAKALGSASNSFALEAFKNNPLVAIQHDGDLSRIEDNTRLNSLVSHESMTVNEKFKSTYVNQFKCFLFMGTNKPVKITDAKSGLIRRLIDVSPTGNRLSAREYKTIMKQIGFELGAIAHHCREVYLADPGAYDNYVPLSMLGASNDFYNFVEDSWPVFTRDNETTLKAAWEMYKVYCDDAKVNYPYSQRAFKEELKNYFLEYKERAMLPDGTRVRSHYSGFRKDSFTEEPSEEPEEIKSWLEFKAQRSLFDDQCASCPAQYANERETPTKKWAEVTTVLSDLDTSKLHYAKVPDEHIVIDFDMTDENGNKCFKRNLEEASKWPKTYAELSKSGEGLHLHYIYVGGDPNLLSRVYGEHIEVKVFTGGSSLRRKLTQCNDIPIADISHGLPMKGVKNTVNFEAIKSEKALRTLIKRNLRKEIISFTKPSVDFIHNDLKAAYDSGMKYDVSDMRPAILAFAASSSNQADICIKLVNKMKFKSEDTSAPVVNDFAKIIFYDVEVFPNLFLVNWKIEGKDRPVVRLINPSPMEIEELMKYRLVGFNCRRYDNHILYARLMGYDNMQLYKLSQRIIAGDRNAFFSEAYNVSYTDVYDFASAGNKMSLKKFEIKLGIHHQELGLPWDQPVDESLWPKVAEYCDNDVIATEATFQYLSADWTARQILADIAGLTVNDTTNQLTTKIIFGSNRKPQDQFYWRDLAEPVKKLDPAAMEFLKKAAPEMMTHRHGEAKSLLPYFPGYQYRNGVSTYRGEEVGEGGYVYAEPGMYGNVALLDIVSMHPHSMIAEVLFGPVFTMRFKEIVDGRVSIKHEAWNEVNRMLDGKLTPYIQKVKNGEMTSEELANALKTAINSVYGQTFAGFDNAFRDLRNIDNIVAKRGALFMVNLKHEVQARGFTVAHIKTDSIKIPDATPEIIQFVMDYGKQYGYTFEHEATYKRMCLVNDAVYIARYKSPKRCEQIYGYVPKKNCKHDGKWTATGAQFQVPYVFKTLFSKEDITFKDLCETKSVASAIYIDLNEGMSENEHHYKFIGKVSSFCPVKSGVGGGLLMRETLNKKTGEKGYAAVTGTKGYRWLESEMVKKLGSIDVVDIGYYNRMVDEAVSSIKQYGDFEEFVSDDPYDVPPES